MQVAFRYAMKSHQLLTAAHANVQFAPYPDDGHTLSPAMIADVKAFLEKLLA